MFKATDKGSILSKNLAYKNPAYQAVCILVYTRKKCFCQFIWVQQPSKLSGVQLKQLQPVIKSS